MLRKQLAGISLFAALILGLFVLTACPGPENGADGCPDGEVLNDDGECVPIPTRCELGEPGCCVRTGDCVHLSTDTHAAVCDRSTGTCYMPCVLAADCPDFYPERCADGQCVCDLGSCVVPACSSHADCGGEGLCIGGECAQGEANPDGCVIAPTPVYTKQGETVLLHAYATKGSDYVVPAGFFAWSSNNNDAVHVEDDTGLVTGGAEAGSTTITATVGSASCTVDVVNFAELESGARVIVLDELDRTPISGATVVVIGDETDTLTTDGQGVVEFESVADAGSVSFHIMAGASPVSPSGYAYVSVLDTTERDLIFYVPRNPGGNAGGIKGNLTIDDFEHINDKNVYLALAGLSIPANVVDLDLTVLLGQLVETDISFAGAIDAEDVPLPSGLVIGYQNETVKSWYAPLSTPGLRTGWMLGGKVDLQEAIQIASNFEDTDFDDMENLPVADFLNAILPMFESFYSAVRPGIMVQPVDLPESDREWPPDNFQDGNLSLTNPLALKGIIDMPSRPTYRGVEMEASIVIGGAMVEGQGLVPMGLTAGAELEGNPDDDAVGPGQLAIRLAPQHSGIEGSRYALLGVSLSFDGLFDDDARIPISGLMKPFDSLSYEQGISFDADSFPAVAEDASYNTLTRMYTPGVVSGAQIYRASITGENEQNWVVYHAGTSAFELIDPDQFGAIDPFAQGAEISAQAVVSRQGVTMDTLFGFNSTNMDHLMDAIIGFSSIKALME